MGKNKKAHKKKVANRNQRLKNDAKFVQRQRAKLIQQLIKDQELKKEQDGNTELEQTEEKIED